MGLFSWLYMEYLFCEEMYYNVMWRCRNTPYTATRIGPHQTDFTRIIIYSPLKKTLFYPYHFILFPQVILQLILYSLLYFKRYIPAFQHTRIYVPEISYLKAVSIVCCNIRELQPKDDFKRKAETCSCHYHINII